MMRRVRLTKKELTAILKHYDAVKGITTGLSTTYKDNVGLLIAVAFYDYSGELKQVFIPDYVVEKCPTIANTPCAGARVNGHGTG